MRKRLSKIKRRLALVLSMVIIFQFGTTNVLAAEKNVDNSMQNSQYISPFSSDASTASTNGTYYFIKEQTFSFTNYNYGNSFYVPNRCQGRLIIAVVAEDKSTSDFIKVKLTVPGTKVYDYITIQTGTAKLFIFEDVPAGNCHFSYYGNRTNIKYTVNISFYTWDY